ncbi:ATP-binding cassette domain-containing protein [Streptococcus sp. zg-86]|uniref:ATP-binding cassette domain-containing protein n=1 Tax=Streptococcus zhangguiae TaxID=2664091 RepID=A0A6I4RRQ7_9STRE|nr:MULTISPECIES: ABC transporter ATP-binding protein [unclassified Streptococcus]MTB64848.1 ATP-binding cassette domain-containing protein [Streptococcus sp. zg-86]MTB91082.1 ATP-binding cassette domain-containing protein [Streptococcus sp. zg-36]MWV56835.1 ATP-binding cassette domain-containing protein [Streptococcus sp. zg-70]QTH48359.1 ABC transporter ATP-binding protein [Streptococcus sp. zg-86]
MRVMLTLLKEVRHVKGLFGLGILIYLGASTFVRLSPILLQQIIDGPITDLSKGLPFDQVAFLWQLATYIAVNIVGALFFYLSTRILMHCANRIAEILRNRTYDQMQRLPISYFDDKPAGKIATRIVNDTETLRNQFYATLVYIFNNLVYLVFTYGVIFYMNVHLGLVLLALLPVFYGLQLLYKRLTDQPMKDFYDARSDINTKVNEAMNGASLIQLYGQEEAIMQDFEQTATKMKQAENRVIWAQSIATWNMTEMVKYLVITLVLTIIGQQFLAGQWYLTAGLLFVYINYVSNAFDAMGRLVQQLPNMLRSLETGKRLLALLEEPMENDSEAELVVTTGRVVFDHVQFAYEEGKPILKDISFEVEKGETIALVGHTGSGKTSIMNLLYRFYDPQKGQVQIDGQNIRDYSRESVRNHMGIVLQDPYLFTGTIASNVSMNDEEMDRQKVLESLEKVGATDLLCRLEKGIDEPVVEKGAAFSSGERQLIAFARTLYSDPKILILDEATSHIDTETEEIIQHAMEVVKEGRTTFIIAHRLSTIQNANQILVLDKGEIVERGNHEELIALEGIYAQMQAIQQRVDTQF